MTFTAKKSPDGRYNLMTKEARYVGTVSDVPYAKYVRGGR